MADLVIPGRNLRDLDFLPDAIEAELYAEKGGSPWRIKVGEPNGIPTLGSDGKVPSTQLPTDVADAPGNIAALDARLDTVEAGQTAGMLGYATKALMTDDLAHAEGTLALVTNDDVDPVANNGTYLKAGASGAGSWGKSEDRVTGLEGRTADLEGKWHNQAGKINGWPDPFFRTFDLTSDVLFGRSRWHNHTSNDNSRTKWTRVANSVFDGYALRRDADAGTMINGPVIWLDEIGVATGDTITAYVLVVGDGAVVSALNLFKNASHATVGSGVNSLSSAGTQGVTASATPQWLRVSVTVPAGAAYLLTAPSTATAGKTFDVVACWAFKGDTTKGPAWPTQPDGVAADNTRRIALLEPAATLNTAKTGYAVDSYGTVSGSASIALDVAAPGNFARDLVFMGWGETYNPAGVTFNALRVKSISRTPGASAKWRTLNVVVRTGATPYDVGATLVAVGSAMVIESKDTQSDVTIVLKDPATGAVKTLTDADFSGGKYFIGVYALKADGTPAACGEPRGTMTNTAGQSYYHASSANNPKSGAWSVNGGNSRMGFQHLLITSPVESTAYAPTQQLVNDLGAQTAIPVPETILPAYLYGVQGREMNVYLDNLHVADAADYKHNIDTSNAVGQQQNERFTWTPSGAQAAGTLTFNVHDKRTGSLLSTKTAQLRAAAATAGSGMTKKVMVIGDSLVNAGTITQTLLDIVTGGDVMGVTLLGTRGTGSNKHEGRGGWTVNYYTSAGPSYRRFTVSGVVQAPSINATTYSDGATTYMVQEVALTGGAGTIDCSVVSGPNTPTGSGTLTKTNGSAGDATIAFSANTTVTGNPFWIAGAINFGQYLTNNSFSAPDWVFIALGINDCFGQTDDTACSSAADSAFTALDTLIASIKAADANTKIGLMIPSPPSADQDAFGANYGVGQPRWRFKRNIVVWARQLMLKYNGQEASRIYVVPSNTALDTVNNMNRAASAPINSRTATTSERQNNGVHPAASGYQQIGDALWAFLKFYA